MNARILYFTRTAYHCLILFLLALMSDALDSQTLSTLLTGPCELDYTKMKTLDHFLSEPSADELVMRHRIHNRAEVSLRYRL